MKKLSILLVILICILGCDSSNSDSAANFSETGQGGSLARFTIKNDYLYTVDIMSLQVFNVADSENPVQVNTIPIGFNIETIFNYKDFLYIGSQNGMFIFSIENPEQPTYLSDVQHFTACDPVIADGVYAYVTLHSDIGCGTTVNLLEIYDVTDVLNPILINSRNLTRPIGIGLYGDYLFVCDDEVKIFNVSDPENIELGHSLPREAFDVIIYNDLLILIGDNGLYQYSLDETNIENIQELSTINI